MRNRSEESEEALMEAYVAGDPRAFQILFERLAPPLHGFFQRAVGAAAADDLLQATFMKVHGARGRWRRGERVRPWVFAIAGNVRVDWARRHGRAAEEELREEELEAADDPGDPGTDLLSRERGDRVRDALRRLDETLTNIPFQPDLKTPVPAKNAAAPTAVVITRDFDGIGIHSVLSISRLFPDHFNNVVFVSVGVIDSGRFKGLSEIENLRRAKEEDLKSFVDFANCLGWYAEYRYSLGIDLMAELEKLCGSVAQEFPRAVFFAGKLVFEQERLFSRVLHNHTPFTLEQRLQFEGLQMVILPIRVSRPSGSPREMTRAQA